MKTVSRPGYCLFYKKQLYAVFFVQLIRIGERRVHENLEEKERQQLKFKIRRKS